MSVMPKKTKMIFEIFFKEKNSLSKHKEMLIKTNPTALCHISLFFIFFKYEIIIVPNNILERELKARLG